MTWVADLLVYVCGNNSSVGNPERFADIERIVAHRDNVLTILSSVALLLRTIVLCYGLVGNVFMAVVTYQNNLHHDRCHRCITFALLTGNFTRGISLLLTIFLWILLHILQHIEISIIQRMAQINDLLRLLTSAASLFSDSAAMFIALQQYLALMAPRYWHTRTTVWKNCFSAAVITVSAIASVWRYVLEFCIYVHLEPTGEEADVSQKETPAPELPPFLVDGSVSNTFGAVTTSLIIVVALVYLNAHLSVRLIRRSRVVGCSGARCASIPLSTIQPLNRTSRQQTPNVNGNGQQTYTIRKSAEAKNMAILTAIFSFSASAPQLMYVAGYMIDSSYDQELNVICRSLETFVDANGVEFVRYNSEVILLFVEELLRALPFYLYLMLSSAFRSEVEQLLARKYRFTCRRCSSV